ncbi:MAG TPA: hypothetical protein VM621_10635 [Luteibacter sp.]|uniref:hypothetical protein n=1 Tax=Luteibacter sp. TaxID=1886636 RepID=UPI002B6BF71A|nr:hypothetical protein [Luteibacter sp.]HVI55492.1 hypothetical protein [Luteibacter sp.]
MPVHWKTPSVTGAPYFAEWDGVAFAYVTSTAWPVDPWRIAIFPHGVDDEHSFGARVATEALAKKFVERWAEANHQRIAKAKGRHRMPHEGCHGQ